MRSLVGACALAALFIHANGDDTPSTTVTTTTTEFDPSKRGRLKYGDLCSTTRECGFAGSVCLPVMKTCACSSELLATNHVDKCGKAVGINESCFFNEQCETMIIKTECRDERCACMFEMVPLIATDGTTTCVVIKEPEVSTRHIDPAMIGVLVGMALMFIIICVVLRLFSRARWRENRTIFNTPNPRLMNVSLLKDNKLLHGHDRRGSRASIRPPSRQASQSELQPHSPTGHETKILQAAPAHHHHHQLLRKSSALRRDSRSGSNLSGNSIRSHKSPTTPTPNNNHSTTTPMLESVTIDIQEPKS